MEPKIEKANMDGSERTTIVNSSMVDQPNHVFLDYNTNRLDKAYNIRPHKIHIAKLAQQVSLQLVGKAAFTLPYYQIGWNMGLVKGKMCLRTCAKRTHSHYPAHAQCVVGAFELHFVVSNDSVNGQ